MVSLLCDYEDKMVRVKVYFEKGVLPEALNVLLDRNSPSNVLLKIKVFGEDFVTEITLQLWTFSFQLLC